MAEPTRRAVYLDHAATSPIRPEVTAAMTEVWEAGLGNPSGAHRLARAARRRLDDAREEVAVLLGRSPGDIVFTSGGTEADNLAIGGVVGASDAPGAHAVCGATEHHAVLDPVMASGGSVVGVDRTGRVRLDELDERLTAAGPAAVLVSVMLANNETGVIPDLAVAAAPAALVSISAHKLGGPVGVGVLALPSTLPIAPMLVGGGQERGRRSGTVDLAGVVGLAAALRLAAGERAAVVERATKQRDRLAAGLVASVPGLVETVPEGVNRTAGTCHVCVGALPSEALLFLLDEAGVSASAASSCASGAQQASHVLAAMGVDPDLQRGSLRLSLGPGTTDADVDAALDAVARAVAQLRAAAGPGGSA